LHHLVRHRRQVRFEQQLVRLAGPAEPATDRLAAPGSLVERVEPAVVETRREQRAQEAALVAAQGGAQRLGRAPAGPEDAALRVEQRHARVQRVGQQFRLALQDGRRQRRRPTLGHLGQRADDPGDHLRPGLPLGPGGVLDPARLAVLAAQPVTDRARRVARQQPLVAAMQLFGVARGDQPEEPA
jgi:hypothetical protein